MDVFLHELPGIIFQVSSFSLTYYFFIFFFKKNKKPLTEHLINMNNNEQCLNKIIYNGYESL